MFCFWLDPNSNLTSNIVITTITEQIAGQCHIHPGSGIAGITLFTIICTDFQNEYNDNNLTYYLYEQYKIDQLFGNAKNYIKLLFYTYSRFIKNFNIYFI